MKFKIGELFSGPGGIGYAAKVAKATAENGEEFSIEHAWATDYDKDTCDTFAHNICNGKSDSGALRRNCIEGQKQRLL